MSKGHHELHLLSEMLQLRLHLALMSKDEMMKGEEEQVMQMRVVIKVAEDVNWSEKE